MAAVPRPPCWFVITDQCLKELHSSGEEHTNAVSDLPFLFARTYGKDVADHLMAEDVGAGVIDQLV